MKITLKKVGLITAFSMILSAALSLMLIKFIIEPETGFFYREYHTFGVWICVLIFVIALFCTVAAALTKKQPVKDAAPCKLFGIANFVMAAAVIYESLFTQIGATIPSWQTLIQVSLGLFSAALLLLFGLAEFGVSEVSPIFDITFILFWLMRAMIVFSNFIPISTVCENVFELTALCSILVFFLVAAKMRNGVKPEGKNKGLLPMAIFTAVICTAYSVPQIIMQIILPLVSSSETKTPGGTYLTDLAFAFFAVAFAVKYYADRKSPAEADEEISETNEPEKEE